jgi:Tol biopolymer transport system component
MLTVSAGTLQAQQLESGKLEAPGEAVPVARYIRRPPGGIAANWAFAASPNVLVYEAAPPGRHQFSVVDRRGQSVANVGNPVLARASWSISRKGDRLVLSHLNAESRSRISILDVLRGQMTPLTGDVGGDDVVWRPDGDRVVFTRRPPNERWQDLFVQRLNSDTAERIGESNAQDKVAHDWHPDGTILFTRQMPPRNQRNFWLLKTDGSNQARLWFESNAQHWDGHFSPDGRYVVYQSDESGAIEVYVRRFPEADNKEKISMAGGTEPRWRPDGKAILYRQNETLIEVELELLPTLKAGTPRPLFDLKDSRGYAVLPDNKGFVVLRPVDPVRPPTITVVLNWTAGLEKK